jgi:hypothetical protein
VHCDVEAPNLAHQYSPHAGREAGMKRADIGYATAGAAPAFSLCLVPSLAALKAIPLMLQIASRRLNVYSNVRAWDSSWGRWFK